MSKDSITYEGQTISELKADFEGAIDDYLASCIARRVEPRKAFSGSLNIRISPDIHSCIAMLAQEAGTTINGYIKKRTGKPVKNDTLNAHTNATPINSTYHLI